MPTPPALDTLLGLVQARLRASRAFGEVELRDGMLVAAALGPEDAAFYRLEWEPGETQGRLWVSLVTSSRWLSESIESALVEHGDDLGELVEDELLELGYEGPGLPPTFQHFRSPDLLYTFRTPLPEVGGAIASGGVERIAQAAAVAGVWVLAYEQAFRRLGDMEGGGEG